MANCPWIQHIGNYGLRENSHEKVATILTRPEAIKALYQDCSPIPSTQARTLFLNFLYDNVLNNPHLTRLEPPNLVGTHLEALLGKVGLKLYEDAVEEERQSHEFREAVFIKSTKHYEGEKWKHRLVLPLGGPSASGKSVSAVSAINALDEVMEKVPESHEGNDVVSIDGGIDREVSQMRQMVLQVALAKGYRGIEDLHEKTPLEVKKYVHDAVLATPGLSMVIPDTFTQDALDYGKSVLTRGMTGGVGQQRFIEYDQLDNGTAILAFGLVEAKKRNVVKSGNGRAWNSSVFTQDDIKMNNTKLPCESKNYQSRYYSAGKKLSLEANNEYKKLPKNKLRATVKIKSDFTFVKSNPNAKYDWRLADKKEPWDPTMVGITLRDLNKWEDYQLKWKKFEGGSIKEDPEYRKQFSQTELLGTARMDLPEWLEYNKKLGNLSKPIIELYHHTPQQENQNILKSTQQIETQTVTQLESGVKRKRADAILPTSGMKLEQLQPLRERTNAVSENLNLPDMRALDGSHLDPKSSPQIPSNKLDNVESKENSSKEKTAASTDSQKTIVTRPRR